MPLALADIERLTSLGHRLAQFADLWEDGTLRLHNTQEGACHFLSPEGLCTIYAHRPEGCRLYPFILEEDRDEVVRDSFCPYNDKFEELPQTKRKVRELVARIEQEARARLSQTPGKPI